MHLAFAILTMLFYNVAAQAWMTDGVVSKAAISIQTRDSLSLTKGVYSSILFTAVPATGPGSKLPIQYQFTEAGNAPPGMIFEAYPCNKPDTKVCPSLASANGIFLDGVPTAAGSYEVEITAADGSGRKGFTRVTLTVNGQ